MAAKKKAKKVAKKLVKKAIKISKKDLKPARSKKPEAYKAKITGSKKALNAFTTLMGMK